MAVVPAGWRIRPVLCCRSRRNDCRSKPNQTITTQMNRHKTSIYNPSSKSTFNKTLTQCWQLQPQADIQSRAVCTHLQESVRISSVCVVRDEFFASKLVRHADHEFFAELVRLQTLTGIGRSGPRGGGLSMVIFLPIQSLPVRPCLHLPFPVYLNQPVRRDDTDTRELRT